MGIGHSWKRRFLNLLSFPKSKKKTHFKIIINIYPVFEFLKRRFKFEVDLCSFCNSACETLQRLFFLCPVSAVFWSEIHTWVSRKINDIPQFDVSDVIFYMDNLHPSVSIVINIIILLGKYHIHCSKGRNSKPSFIWFLNDFKQYFMLLKKLKLSKSVRICDDISNFLLF